MSQLSKMEAQLKSCRYQFNKMVENNKLLCKALIIAEDALDTISSMDACSAELEASDVARTAEKQLIEIHKELR